MKCYGSNSTTWLARDLNQFVLHVLQDVWPSSDDTWRRWRWLSDKYVALKINSGAQAELDIPRHISQANSRHQGWHFIRRPPDSFSLEHGTARHLSLVFEALREPLWIYQTRFIDDVIPSGVLKILLQMVLRGLDYLHSERRVIHTGLSLVPG